MPRIRNVGGVRPQPFFIRASHKLNCALGFVLGIQSSVYGATTVAKVSLCLPGHGLL